MYLCHGAVNTPVGAKGAPTADELLFGFCKFHTTKLNPVFEFSRLIENKISFKIAGAIYIVLHIDTAGQIIIFMYKKADIEMIRQIGREAIGWVIKNNDTGKFRLLLLRR